MLAANFGVIAGIVFLEVELQQNNALLQSEASVAYVNMRVQGIGSWASDAELLEAYAKPENVEAISRVEYLSLDFKYWSIFVNWE